MIGQPEETTKKNPLSLTRIAPAIDKTGRQISVDDKTGHLGGQLNLPKDLPEDSYVVAIIDLTTGDRETKEFHVTKNLGESIELDQKGIPPIVGIMINEKIPKSSSQIKRDQSVVSFGDELNFATIGSNVHCASVYLPKGKNLTFGEVVVITPKMLANYKKSLGF